MERQKMRFITLLFISILLTDFFPAAPTDVYAFRAGEKVTPYGAYCNRISHYVMHHESLSDKEVRQALEHYYGEKDLDFEMINSKGRFIKAFIKDGNKTVDTIIYDRHSGRIRSIY
jgi:hypothetical protein